MRRKENKIELVDKTERRGVGEKLCIRKQMIKFQEVTS